MIHKDTRATPANTSRQIGHRVVIHATGGQGKRAVAQIGFAAFDECIPRGGSGQSDHPPSVDFARGNIRPAIVVQVHTEDGLDGVIA